MLLQISCNFNNLINDSCRIDGSLQRRHWQQEISYDKKIWSSGLNSSTCRFIKHPWVVVGCHRGNENVVTDLMVWRERCLQNLLMLIRWFANINSVEKNIGNVRRTHKVSIKWTVMPDTGVSIFAVHPSYVKQPTLILLVASVHLSVTALKSDGKCFISSDLLLPDIPPQPSM